MNANTISIVKLSADGEFLQEDLVAVEAHYQVFLQDNLAFSFTCTPDALEEMVTGALYSKGFLADISQLQKLEQKDSQIFVTLSKQTDSPQTPDNQHKKQLPEAAAEKKAIILDKKLIFQTVHTLFSNPDTLFNRTGCAHSCSLLYKGKLICTFEDIGRHNALDKVIGYALRNNVPLSQCVIFTSGRISGDYMAKIIHAGMPVAVSRAAVTSEAVSLAKEHGVTLYGFVRGNFANQYTD